MGIIAFTTAPINGGTQYQVTDQSTGFSYAVKRLFITAVDGTVLNDVTVNSDQQVITVSTSEWSAHMGYLQILVALSIDNDTLAKGYLLPTTLNILV